MIFIKCFQMILKHYSIGSAYSMRHAIFLNLDGIWQDLLLWMEKIKIKHMCYNDIGLHT